MNKLLLILVLVAATAGCKSSHSKAATANTSPSGTTVVASSPTTNSAGAKFTLEEGFEHDVCGVGISVKFIPATATSSSADEAVLYGGPINNVPDKIQDHTGDQPLPDNAAELKVGSTVTVVGKQFSVDGIDVENSSTDLVAHC